MRYPPTPTEMALADATITIGGETVPLTDLVHSMPIINHDGGWSDPDVPAVRVFRKNRGPWLQEAAADGEDAKRRSRQIDNLIALAGGTLAWVDCTICGDRHRSRCFQAITRRLVAESHCHTCDYWLQQIATEPDRRLVINGTHYRLGDRTGPASCKGFGGRVHRIRYLDGGRTITTDDLWFQGEIPAPFREQLPDTAEFVRADG